MAIKNELEELKKIFLSPDLDSEDYADNLERIEEWEKGIRENEEFGSWQSSDITQEIIAQAKKTYKDLAEILMVNREYSDVQRQAIWAKQDAIKWLLSLVEKDTKSAIGQIHREIKQALKVE